MAIFMAVLAARSYLSASYLILLSERSAEPPSFSALSAAERQMSRILCAASISPIGHWISSSQISLRLPLPLLNHHIAMPLNICKHRSPGYDFNNQSAAAPAALPRDSFV